MLPIIPHIRGDTLSWACSHATDDGAAIDISTYTIAAQIRKRDGSLLAELTAAITDGPAGEFTLSATATVTAEWDPGEYVCDIQYTSGSTVSSTEMVRVRVVADVTRS